MNARTKKTRYDRKHEHWKKVQARRKIWFLKRARQENSWEYSIGLPDYSSAPTKWGSEGGLGGVRKAPRKPGFFKQIEGGLVGDR